MTGGIAPSRNLEIAPTRDVEIAPSRDLEIDPTRDVEIAPSRDLEIAPTRIWWRKAVFGTGSRSGDRSYKEMLLLAIRFRDDDFLIRRYILKYLHRSAEPAHFQAIDRSYIAQPQ